MAKTAPAPASASSLTARHVQAFADNVDETAATAQIARLKKIVVFQSWVLIALGAIITVTLPFARPVDLYFAINPAKQTHQMVGLAMPNMTNQAVLAWAVNSITEIMTMGFGDIDVKLPKQRVRFTSNGWDAYVKAFIRQNVGVQFKKSQLVLTTVPSNTPVIVWQGVNPDQIYQWVVQMPVIMTYATNNNVTNMQKGIITLTIVRVPVEESPTGIAIENWRLG